MTDPQYKTVEKDQVVLIGTVVGFPKYILTQPDFRCVSLPSPTARPSDRGRLRDEAGIALVRATNVLKSATDRHSPPCRPLSPLRRLGEEGTQLLFRAQMGITEYQADLVMDLAQDLRVTEVPIRLLQDHLLSVEKIVDLELSARNADPSLVRGYKRYFASLRREVDIMCGQLLNRPRAIGTFRHMLEEVCEYRFDFDMFRAVIYRFDEHMVRFLYTRPMPLDVGFRGPYCMRFLAALCRAFYDWVPDVLLSAQRLLQAFFTLKNLNRVVVAEYLRRPYIGSNCVDRAQMRHDGLWVLTPTTGEPALSSAAPWEDTEASAHFFDTLVRVLVDGMVEDLGSREDAHRAVSVMLVNMYLIYEYFSFPEILAMPFLSPQLLSPAGLDQFLREFKRDAEEPLPASLPDLAERYDVGEPQETMFASDRPIMHRIMRRKYLLNAGAPIGTGPHP